MSRPKVIVERQRADAPDPTGPAASVTPIRGLCRSCENAPVCTFPQHLEWPVVQCEEFVGVTVRTFRPAAPSAVGAVAEVAGADVALRGLCRSCENRFACTYSKGEGGVWHCDEYR